MTIAPLLNRAVASRNAVPRQIAILLHEDEFAAPESLAKDSVSFLKTIPIVFNCNVIPV